MDELVRFLHVFGAIAAGFYILFPFLISRVNKLSTAAQEGYITGLFVANRIGQYIFIAQLLTGAHLVWATNANYSTPWIVMVLVGFIILGALAGMMGRPMKNILANLQSSNTDSGKFISKLIIYSIIIVILFFMLVGMMSFPF